MTPEPSLSKLPDGISQSLLGQLPVSLVVTDPRQDDNPIIYVNGAFERTTGYAPSDVIGENCRFLQGENTDPEDVQRLRNAIENKQEATVDIVNYRKNGEAFLNRLIITPVFDQDGQLIYFIGFQYEHRDQKTYMDRARELDSRLREIQHRVKNHLSMIVSLIRIQASRLEPQAAAAMLAQRVETIGLLYEQVDAARKSEDQTIDLQVYLEQVCKALSGLSNEVDVRLDVTGRDVVYPVEDAARLGQVVSEVLTNALQHAFAGIDDRDKKVSVELVIAKHQLELTVSDNGKGLGEAEWPNGSGLGGHIVKDLVARLDGEMTIDTGEWGTVIRLRFPYSS